MNLRDRQPDPDPLERLFHKVKEEAPSEESSHQLRSVVTKFISDLDNSVDIDPLHQNSANQPSPSVLKSPNEEPDRGTVWHPTWNWNLAVAASLAFIAVCCGLGWTIWQLVPLNSNPSQAISENRSKTQELNAENPDGIAPDSTKAAGAFFVSTLRSQEVSGSRPTGELINGNLEVVDEKGNVRGWFFPEVSRTAGYSMVSDVEKKFEGDRSLKISAESVTANSFGNAVQGIDATNLRGKRVRFRAAVCTADLGSNGQAQMWLRVDRQGDGPNASIGAFDNMQDRPIRSNEWKHYEIVVEVASDASSIALGMFLIGTGKAWIDDATLEVVQEETKLTTMPIGSSPSSTPIQTAVSFFFAGCLAIVAFCTLALSQSKSHWLQRIGLRYVSAYWVLYLLPGSIGSFLPIYGFLIMQPYSAAVEGVVRWSARHLLGIERQLVLPNGSGDTTFDYVRVLLCALLAIVIASIWSAVDWRRTDYSRLNDLLRSFIRYTLIFTMLGYGLAKLPLDTSQFPSPSANHLLQTYGESSPMNLLWTFMGSSRPYTVFAGLMEVIAGLLLISRRTTTLGAAFTAAVMLNVVLLNFCYDVPVKQYSLHLFFMAFFLLLPDLRRLSDLLILNRDVQAAELGPKYSEVWMKWPHLMIKIYLIAIGVIVPILNTGIREYATRNSLKDQPEFFGTYELTRYIKNGKELPANISDPSKWSYATLERNKWAVPGSTSRDYLSVKKADRSIATMNVMVSTEKQTIQSDSKSFPSEIQYKQEGKDQLVLTYTTSDGTTELRLKKLTRERFLLVNRGFHWINEFPFNR